MQIRAGKPHHFEDTKEWVRRINAGWHAAPAADLYSRNPATGYRGDVRLYGGKELTLPDSVDIDTDRQPQGGR